MSVCSARVVGYTPRELTGTIQQGDRHIICHGGRCRAPTTDSPPQSLTLPLKTSDKVVVRGKELQIIAADDSTRRVDGILIAHRNSGAWLIGTVKLPSLLAPGRVRQ